MLQAVAYGVAYGMGAKRLAECLTSPKVKVNTKAARKLMAAACKRYNLAGTVTGRLTDRQNIGTLTKRQKRRQ